MQIAFCNKYPQVGNTFNTVAISTMISLVYNMKNLVINSHFNDNSLELSFINKGYLNSDLTELSDTGIDALIRYVKFNKIAKGNIPNYTTTLLKKRLELLPGTTSINRELYYKNLNEAIDMTLKASNQDYDLVFVDVDIENRELTNKICNSSDLIITSLTQNTHLLDDYFSNHEDTMDKSMILLGRYDNCSRFNAKTIKRKYRLKDNVGIIPYNAEFADACYEGRALDYFLKNIKADRDDYNYDFIQEVRKTSERILEKLNIDTSTKKLGD